MNYCIIGASAAGINAIESIRAYDKKSNIALISDEDFSPYSRCLLSYLLAGSLTKEHLHFKPKDFLEKNRVNFQRGVKAERILYKERKVLLSDKSQIPFDKLLLATGARPKIPRIPGIEKRGVYPLRTLSDAQKIEGCIKAGLETAVVLGGGLIGMRSAYALAKRGVKVKVVVKSPHILSQAIDQPSAEIVQGYLEKRGIEVLTKTDVIEISGQERVEEVTLDNGKRIKAGLVIIGKGVVPNSELAEEVGIKIREGILIEKNLETSLKDIFAAGDVVESFDLTSGETSLNPLWPVAVE
ncbi:MAG: NAD(P)/FAD-dependent oxidoreductase, partial [Candidatus Omnitrophota bacterium]